MSNITATLPILTAVNDTFQAIREAHPEVPNVNIVVGSSGRKRGGQVHGHFQAGAWINPEFVDAENDDDTLPEIFLSGESLERGGAGTLGTLLHEAAHALAHARGVRDTSNAGRYHNKKFKKIGEELGILLENVPTIGWSGTTLSMVARVKYHRQIQALDAALVTWRLPDYSAPKKPRTKTKGLIDCGCEDPVTVSLQWFERHEAALKCDDCLEGYHLVDDEA